jgi:hypothetical protein
MRFNVSRIWLILLSALPWTACADLFVLRAGYGHIEPAVLRYNEESGAFIDRFDRGSTNLITGETMEGMCFGPDGNLYATGNSLGFGQINCFDGVTGQLRSILRPPNLFMPTGLRFGSNGLLYVCGSTNSPVVGPSARRVFVLNPTSGATISTIVISSSTYPLYDLAMSKAGLVVVSDYERNQILRLTTFVGLNFAAVNLPTGLTFGPDGHLYVATYTNNSVLKLDGTNGTFLATFVAPGSGGLAYPTSLTFGPDDHLYVVCRGSNAVFRYHGATGSFMDQFVAPRSGGLDGSGAMIEFAPIPRLRVQRAGTNVVISWPAALTNFNLESTSIFPASNLWTAVTNSTVVVGRERVITNSPSANTFYQLRKQ